MLVLSIVILCVLQSLTTGQYLPNPCPKYFKYESDGYRTYGVVEVPPTQLGMNLRVNVELSLQAQLQNVSFSADVSSSLFMIY